MRNLFTNVCLLLVSCTVGLSLCEASLRLFYPKYRHVVEAQFRRDGIRIWARIPNSRDWTYHPETPVLHFLHHNNLALRQHRDFGETDLAAATNIGFFGDSFTENTGMAAPYSFTEPLDYLLNQSGNRFNVLNFGVDGYGPGQSLLHYESFRYVEDLDHLFYVYWSNDLLNIHQTGLFSLDDAGRLVQNEAIRESWWGALIRRVHISYLVLEGGGLLSSFLADTAVNTEYLRGERELQHQRDLARMHAFRQGRSDDYDQENSLKILRQLIRRWKHLAEHNGSTFSVVLLPFYPRQPFVVDLLNAEDVEVIDLYDCFRDADPPHHPRRRWHRSPYRFKSDGHWNEVGNRVAAVCLYRVLEEKMGLPRLSESRMQDALFQYYATFGGESLQVDEGGGQDWALWRQPPRFGRNTWPLIRATF